jgi:hypothetical protein
VCFDGQDVVQVARCKNYPSFTVPSWWFCSNELICRYTAASLSLDIMMKSVRMTSMVWRTDRISDRGDRDRIAKWCLFCYVVRC